MYKKIKKKYSIYAPGAWTGGHESGDYASLNGKEWFSTFVRQNGVITTDYRTGKETAEIGRSVGFAQLIPGFRAGILLLGNARKRWLVSSHSISKIEDDINICLPFSFFLIRL